MRTYMIICFALVFSNLVYGGDIKRIGGDNGRLEGKGSELKLTKGNANTKLVNTKYGYLIKNKSNGNRLEGKGHMTNDLRARHDKAFKKK